MTGQPEETEEDVQATLELIDELKYHHAKMFYTPVLFIPLKDALLGDCKRTSLTNLTELQWEVLRCHVFCPEFWRRD